MRKVSCNDVRDSADGEVDHLRRLSERYGASPRLQSMLSLHLYEVSVGCQKYLSTYKSLLALPNGSQDTEPLAEELTSLDLLIDDVIRHSRELRREIGRFLKILDKEE